MNEINKKKSILSAMLDKVSKLPWLKNKHFTQHEKMKPGKGFNQPVSDHAFDYLKELNDEEFDKLIAMIFKQRGYSILEGIDNPKVDVALQMNGQTTFVQYIHWREHHVDAATLERFYNAIDDESNSNGIVITTGTFTAEALEFVSGKSLMLIDGVDLSQMVDVLTSSNQEELEELMDETEEIEEMPELEPLCPICSQKMIKRTAKKGKNAGNSFWGCSQFPNCRGVVSP